jgi:hypothetical protein
VSRSKIGREEEKTMSEAKMPFGPLEIRARPEQKALIKAAEKYGSGLLLAAGRVMRHRLVEAGGLGDDDSFFPTQGDYDEFFAEITKRQVKLLCQMADTYVPADTMSFH